ncbi:hypothetical protein CGH49_23230 [Vibrio parahaemolyticus]|nr:hypothetical protein [Vibrio parahaemolyticus]TON79185.1 hypothetical protein CGH49_23230 [Vibrio parahaemolyticus]
MSKKLNKHLRRIHNARHFQLELALVFTAQWFRWGDRRYSPLNAALHKIYSSTCNSLVSVI